MLERVNLGYQPRPQFIDFHKRTARWSTIVAHRRVGKTVACIADLVAAALECKLPNPRFAYIAPLFVQAKDTAWMYLKHYTYKIPGVSYNEAELRVDLPNGARIRLYGADNYDRLRGLYFDGVILDEYADMPPAAWEAVIRPALSDRGGWAVFIGTPKGRNAFYEKYQQSLSGPEWFSLMLKASETGVLSAAELADARKSQGEDLYNQEYECDFTAALIGAYYGKEIKRLEADKHIGPVSYDPSLQVYTAWDLGIDDSTAIWFAQQLNQEIRLIDYYEASGCGLDHYAKLLKEKPYTYAEHLLPHDAQVKELGSGRSRVETLQGLGVYPTVIPAQSIEDGINAVRLILPRCWFDETKTAKGLESLRQYQREWDEKMKTFRQRPRHDWTSHAADAFRYLAIGLPGNVSSKPIQYRNSRSII